MKRQRITAAIVGSGLLILLGVTGMLTGLRVFGEETRPILRMVKAWTVEPPAALDGLWSFGGYTIVLLVGVWLAGVHLSSSPRDSVIMETEEGPVELSLDALDDVIQSVREQVTGIQRATPNVATRDRGVNLRVELELSGSAEMPGVVEQFKNRLRRQLSDIFNIKELESFTVRINNMSDYRPRVDDEEGDGGDDTGDQTDDGAH